MARVFGIDVETCAECGGKTKIIAAIVDPAVVRKILDSLGLPNKAPPISPARGPPQAADFADLNQDVYPLDNEGPARQIRGALAQSGLYFSYPLGELGFHGRVASFDTVCVNAA